MKKVNFMSRIMLMILIPVIITGVIITAIGLSNVASIGTTGIKNELYAFGEATLMRYEAMNKDAYTFADNILGNCETSSQS